MTERRQRDGGSVLMLMPAGVLVVLMLGAIAFDLSVVFLRQRQASSLVVDVANDLASSALDADVFRREGRFELDPAAARGLAQAHVAASDLAADVSDIEVTLIGPDAVEVRVVLRVRYVFARAIPGAARGTTVTAAATAVAG